MTKAPQREAWMMFVVRHGWRASSRDLAFIIGVPRRDIERFRAEAVSVRLEAKLTYQALFFEWHGRQPTEMEWPTPTKKGGGSYEWQEPELQLLVQLSGVVSTAEIAATLTARLKRVTNDAEAVRTVEAITLIRSRKSLPSAEPYGGITIAKASEQIGTKSEVLKAIRRGDLEVTRTGRQIFITARSYERWTKKIRSVPDGYVRLASIRAALGITSDKLAEYARRGFVSDAVQAGISGMGVGDKHGVWWVPRTVADQLVRDRAARKKMPWAGRTGTTTLRSSYWHWHDHKHPASCLDCERIWGANGPPRDFADYAVRYQTMTLAEKRHLSSLWVPDLSIKSAAELIGLPEREIRGAIANGILPAVRIKRRLYLTIDDVRRWHASGADRGRTSNDWIGIREAERQFLFSYAEISALMSHGLVPFKKHGLKTFVSRRACHELRETIGFSQSKAAAGLYIKVDELRRRLSGETLGPGGTVPQHLYRKLAKSRRGPRRKTVDEVAAIIGVTPSWVTSQVNKARKRSPSPELSQGGPTFSMRDIKRLRIVAESSGAAGNFTEPRWLGQAAAALEAGVSTSTLLKWAREGEVERQRSKQGWLYSHKSVRKKARQYWTPFRIEFRNPPNWLRKAPPNLQPKRRRTK